MNLLPMRKQRKGKKQSVEPTAANETISREEKQRAKKLLGSGDIWKFLKKKKGYGEMAYGSANPLSRRSLNSTARISRDRLLNRAN